MLLQLAYYISTSFAELLTDPLEAQLQAAERICSVQVCYAVPSAGTNLIFPRWCACIGHAKMLILTGQMLANFCCVGKTETGTLLSVRKRIRARLQKGADEMLAHM